MKNIIILSLLIVSSTFCFTQNITFEPALPAPEFQKADVGAIDFADVDNDGDIDFMATGKGTPMQDPVLSTLYKNDGSGNFTEVLNTPFVDVFGGAIGFADIDNDNDLDLFITGNTHGGWRSAELYTNDGTGDYSIVTGTPFEPNWGGDFAFADMDGDGDQDLIMTGINQDDDALTKLYSNNGTGVFSEVTGTSFEQLGLGAVEFLILMETTIRIYCCWAKMIMMYH